MADIRMSSEVRAAVGPDLIAELLGMSLAGGRCVACQQPLPADGPASVVVLRDPDRARAAFTHPSCSPSVLHDVSAVPMPGAGDDETMTITPFLASQGAILLPALVAEVSSRLFRVPRPSEHGEPVNMIVSTMLSEGFQLITRLRQRLHLLDGWTATIIDGTPVLMTITTGTGGLFYDGTAIPPDGWLNAARGLGWCAVYGGAVQMPDHGPASKGTRVLQAAAAAGGLVGARVAVETH